MDSYRIWVSNINDMCASHIFNGMNKTFNDVNRLTGGNMLDVGVKTAMEGIPTLSSNILRSDYQYLLRSLQANGKKTEQDLNELIRNAYYSYAMAALNGAGVQATQLDPTQLDGSTGMDFIHAVYVNVARDVWLTPEILIEHRTMELMQAIGRGIEKAIRDAINLPRLIKHVQTGAYFEPSVRERPKPVKEYMKERMQNAGSLLSDTDDSSSEDEEEKPSTEANETIPLPRDGASMLTSKIPEQPYLGDDIETNDDRTDEPDTITIKEETDDDDGASLLEIGKIQLPQPPAIAPAIAPAQVGGEEPPEASVNLELAGEEDDTETVVPSQQPSQAHDSMRMLVDDTMRSMNIKQLERAADEEDTVSDAPSQLVLHGPAPRPLRVEPQQQQQPRVEDDEDEDEHHSFSGGYNVILHDADEENVKEDPVADETEITAVDETEITAVDETDMTEDTAADETEMTEDTAADETEMTEDTAADETEITAVDETKMTEDTDTSIDTSDEESDDEISIASSEDTVLIDRKEQLNMRLRHFDDEVKDDSG